MVPSSAAGVRRQQHDAGDHSQCEYTHCKYATDQRKQSLARWQQHQAGIHTLCRSGYCPQAGVTPAVTLPPPPSPPPPTAEPPPQSTPSEQPERSRRCSTCGTKYESYLVEAAFRTLNSHGRLDASKRRWLCRPCEQTRRDEKKVGNRWHVKARDTIRRHAERFSIPQDRLTGQYGWEASLLAHEAEHAYGNGCSYCNHPYLEMGHGLADITLDIIDRGKPPYYRTNTKWCCQTCNRKKGVMTPEQFELDRQVFGVWSEQRGQATGNPQEAGFLF